MARCVDCGEQYTIKWWRILPPLCDDCYKKWKRIDKEMRKKGW